MEIIQQILFVAALAVAVYYVIQRVNLIRRAIQLGRAEDRTDHPGERLKIMALVAFGQKKMLTNRLVGVMHFIIYAGFIIINLEIVEIILMAFWGVTGFSRLTLRRPIRI